MAKEMLINVAEREECRVAVVDKGSLEELYIERASLSRRVGNVYKGKVQILSLAYRRRLLILE